jgi:hypothetical protein
MWLLHGGSSQLKSFGRGQPREDAMKLNHFALINGSKIDSLGRRKRERDSTRIDAAVKAALDELDHHSQGRAAFLNLLGCVRGRTSLLKPTSGHGTPGWVAPLFLLNRLRNLATRQNHWIRPCETWQPEPGNLRAAFRSLSAHLLTYYPVPGFMDSAWDLPDGPEGFRQQSWFIKLGRGASFRSLNLPLILTRSMEHYLRRAPDHYSVSQALRFAETRGMGGSEKLALEIAGGRLGQRIERPDFWRTVLRFFVAHPEMQLEHVNPIVDFVHVNKFAGDEVLTTDGIQSQRPPWPNFSMEGRTLRSILRLVSAWHADLGITKNAPWCSWRKSGIQGYRFVEKQSGEEGDRDWTIVELLNSTALHTEGRAMHHCVYTYANSCRRGETTIWSLRLRAAGEEKRMVTIEVDPHKRTIIQARAKCNRWPGARSGQIIRQWASRAGLGLAVEV